VTILGSHLVTTGGVAQPVFVSGLNEFINGRDVSFDAPAGTYSLQTDLAQSYGSFTVSSANTISGTTGALVASGNQIDIDLTKLAAVTVTASHLLTLGGIPEGIKIQDLVNFIPGRDDTAYVPAGTFPLATPVNQAYGSFTVADNGTGTLVVTATSGAAVASGNRIDFDLTKLCAVTVGVSDLVTAGGLPQSVKVYEAANFIPGRNDTVYVGAGSYGLTTAVNQSYGGFTVADNGSGTLAVTSTSGAAVASGNRIDFVLSKLCAVTVGVSDLVTAGGLAQALKVYEVANFIPGRDDTVYIGAGSYGLATPLNLSYGSFTVADNGSGTLAVTAASGAGVTKSPNRVDINPCALNRIRITPSPGVTWAVANVSLGSSATDVVALPDGSFILQLYGTSTENPTLAPFSVSAASGLSATQLPQGSPLVTLALAPCTPVVGPIATTPATPVPINTTVAASASFTDPGLLETHTALWNWGDGSTSAGTVTESNGSGSVGGSHVYTKDGVYTLTLTVTDDDDASGQSVFQYVVVYNASAGFVTAGGWFTSPAGAYTANPSLTGKATFGLNAKYQSGSAVPMGNTEFQFPAANLNFHATGYDWLVISGSQAQYQGSGTLNGAGNYGFLVSALDNGGGSNPPDRFRLKIWDKNNNNAVVYDTQPGAATTAQPTTVLGGGRIQVHSNGPMLRIGGNSGSQVPPATGGGSANTTSDQALGVLLFPADTAAPFVADGGSQGQTECLPVGQGVWVTSRVASNAVGTPPPALPHAPSIGMLDRLFADLVGSGLTDAPGVEYWWKPLA
jgi:hypothetical protein